MPRSPVLDTYVDTRDIDVAELHEYPGNARRGNVAELRKSLRRHGQYRALIVQDLTEQGDGYRILAGNHTYAGLRAEGWRSVRCEIHRLDDDLARRIAVADNRHANLGYEDTGDLLQLLSYLDGDLDGTGYTDDDVTALLEAMNPDPEDDDDGQGEGGGDGSAPDVYELVFETPRQKDLWLSWLAQLRMESGSAGTDTQLVCAHIEDLGL